MDGINAELEDSNNILASIDMDRRNILEENKMSLCSVQFLSIEYISIKKPFTITRASIRLFYSRTPTQETESLGLRIETRSLHFIA
jgi:hypothetical protein